MNPMFPPGKGPGRHSISPGLMAIILMLISAVFSSAAGAAIRQLVQELHFFEVVFWRIALTLPLILPLLWREGVGHLSIRRLTPYLWRSILMLASMVSWYWALVEISLAEATALSFTAPLFATILAALFLSETVRVRRWSATAIGFLGALIIIRPDPAAFSPGALLALTSSALSAVSIIIIKRLTRSESPVAILGITGLISLPIAALPAIFFWQGPDWADWPLLLLMAGSALAGQWCFTHACSLADASALMPYDYSRLISAALIGYVAFGELPDAYTWAGAAVIAGSAVYIAHREAKLRSAVQAATHAVAASSEAAQIALPAVMKEPRS